MGDNFDLKKFLTENKLTQINQINEQDEEWSITPSSDWYPQKSIKKKKSYILVKPERIPLPIYVTNIDEDEVEYESDWSEGNEDYGLVWDPHTGWFDLDKVLDVKNTGDEVKIYLSKHETLNEQDKDDFNVTPNEEEWNKFEIGDIITVDWTNEPHSSGFPERFQNKPFKIADDYENGGSNYYKVVPADKETKELWNKEMYWDFHYVKKNNVKPYYGELSEQDDDEWTVTPDEKEWNKPEVGSIVTVDIKPFMPEAYQEFYDKYLKQFENAPFKVTDIKDWGGTKLYKLVPVDKETRRQWKKNHDDLIKDTETFRMNTWFFRPTFYYTFENYLKPYSAPINEQDEEWTITPDESHWNQPEIGDEVLINWNEVDYFDVYYNDKWFIEIKDIPFKIVGKEKADENILSVDIYGIAPVDKKYDAIWNYHLGRVWWVTEKALKPYQDSINEQDEDDFNVTPDESHWNELEVGDEVLVDWDMVNDFDIGNDMTWFHPMKNKPFKIIDKMKDLFYGNIYGIAPVDEKDNDEWDYNVGGIWWVVEKTLKLYQGSVNEEQDDEFNVTAGKEWNQPGVGDIITVDWDNEGYHLFKTFNFENKPFKIISDVNNLDSFLVEPVEAEDKENFYTVVINGKGWLVGKDNIKPYQGPLNENDDEWTVTPNEDEWNAPDVGDIVIVDFTNDTDRKRVHKFNNVPFKIIREIKRRTWDGEVTNWWVEPVKEQDKAKWKKAYDVHQTHYPFNYEYWTDKGWAADKENVKKYTEPLNENEENNDEWSVTPDEKEWNKLVDIGDLVTVDWIQVEFDEVFMPFENKPFEIVDEYSGNWLIFPYKEEDKQKWIEMVKKKFGPESPSKYWINKNKVKPYINPINEDTDDDFNVTPDEKEWNKPDIGSIVTVDFEAETDEHEEVHQFIGVPFDIVGESVKYDSWWVEPYRAEDKAKWKEVKMKWGEDNTWYWTDEKWLAFKRNVRPYEGPLNENEDTDDDFNVTPDEKEWNVPDVGDIVTVDFKEETNKHKKLHKFNNVPFKIIREIKRGIWDDEVTEVTEWWVEPVREEDKIKWKKAYNADGLQFQPEYWTDKGWAADKENVKPYQGPLNEDENDNDFNVTASKEWNKLDVGDLVTVDFKKEGASRILQQFNNVPFEIVSETNPSEMWWIEPYRAEDKIKWKELREMYFREMNFVPMYWTDQGWAVLKNNVKPYEGPLNENENNDEWSVTPDEKEWNKPDVGSIVTVDFKEDTGYHKDVWQFNNVPFEIISEDGVDDDLWWVEPVKAEDKKKWKEVHEMCSRKINFVTTYWTDQGWAVSKKNVKPYQG